MSLKRIVATNYIFSIMTRNVILADPLHLILLLDSCACRSYYSAEGKSSKFHTITAMGRKVHYNNAQENRYVIEGPGSGRCSHLASVYPYKASYEYH